MAEAGEANGTAAAGPVTDMKPDVDMEAGATAQTALVGDRAGDYVRELLNEKQSLDPSQWPNASRLLDQEVTKEVARIQSGGKPTARESKYVDIYREKPIRVAVKVLVPIKEHPKFNFVGKLLGPKGNSMKRLQEDTMTKMAVLGRGSMKDKQKEEELRTSMDPKYAHLSDDLHVEIAAFAPPAEAHARIAYALAELRKYLIPDSNDEIRQEQMREMEMLVDPVTGTVAAGGGAPGGGRRGAARGGGGGGRGARGGHTSVRSPGAGAAMGGGLRGPVGGLPPPPPPPPMAGRSPAGRGGLLVPPRGGGGGGGPVGMRKPLPPPPPPPPLPPSQALLPGPTPTKTKVLSILERARAAMEETAYGCDDVPAASAVAAAGAAPAAFFDSGGYDSYGAAGYLPMAHRYSGGGGGYEDYDDGAGDYYEPHDAYAGAEDVAGCSWKGFKSPAAGVAADRSRFRTAPYSRPTK